MSELARKDLFVCLGIWLALEIVCFALLPASPFGQKTWASLQPWFLFSILAGMAGAYLLSSDVQLKELFQRRDFFIRNRLLQRCLRLMVSWLGFLGIGFPLLVISLQLFSKLFELLKT